MCIEHNKDVEKRWPKLANWLLKTAMVFNEAVKLEKRVEFARGVAKALKTGQLPDYTWVDLGQSKLQTIGGIIGKGFRLRNGGRYVQNYASGEGFQFIVQFNHLLLRIGRLPSPGANVIYDPKMGGEPVRIYPEASDIIPGDFLYENYNEFLYSVILDTWKGCPGNIPKQPS